MGTPQTPRDFLEWRTAVDRELAALRAQVVTLSVEVEALKATLDGGTP